MLVQTTVPKMPSLEASEVKGERVSFLERDQHLIIVATKMTNNNVCLFRGHISSKAFVLRD